MGVFKNGVGRPSNRTKKIRLGMVLSITAIIALTVVFAALSRALTINGSAKFSGDWDIHFAPYENGAIAKDERGYATGTIPQISSDKLTLNNFAVSFVAPGDSVEYKFKIVNEGTIAGAITGIITTNAEIEAGNDEFLKKLKDNFEYELKYEDTEEEVAEGDVFEAESSRDVVLTYKLNDFDYTGNVILDEAVTISDLTFTINFEQTNSIKQEQEDDPQNPTANLSYNVSLKDESTLDQALTNFTNTLIDDIPYVAIFKAQDSSYYVYQIEFSNSKARFRFEDDLADPSNHYVYTEGNWIRDSQVTSAPNSSLQKVQILTAEQVKQELGAEEGVAFNFLTLDQLRTFANLVEVVE